MFWKAFSQLEHLGSSTPDAHNNPVGQASVVKHAACMISSEYSVHELQNVGLGYQLRATFQSEMDPNLEFGLVAKGCEIIRSCDPDAWQGQSIVIRQDL